jgi:hypothetical protein
VDKDDPVIVVDLMYSPSYYVRKEIYPGPAPDLNAASDVIFLQYYLHGLNHMSFPPASPNSQILAPKHIFIQNIVTNEVVELFQKLMHQDNQDLEEPDGQEFDPDQEEGKLLLGTRHGTSVCMFLIQHKAQFGLQEVKKIRLWYDDKDDFWEWHLYFEIGKVEDEEKDPNAMDLQKRDFVRARL